MNTIKDIYLALEMGIADKIWKKRCYINTLFQISIYTVSNDRKLVVTAALHDISEISPNKITFTSSDTSFSNSITNAKYEVRHFEYLCYNNGNTNGGTYDSSIWTVDNIDFVNNTVAVSLKLAS